MCINKSVKGYLMLNISILSLIVTFWKPKSVTLFQIFQLSQWYFCLWKTLNKVGRLSRLNVLSSCVICDLGWTWVSAPVIKWLMCSLAVIHKFDYVFAENGTVQYKDGKLVSKHVSVYDSNHCNVDRCILPHNGEGKFKENGSLFPPNHCQQLWLETIRKLLR